MELNKIYCIDNVEGMKKYLPDESIDLTVTSPPYDNLRKYKGFSWDFQGVANELFRVTKIGGVVVWVVNDATINGSETLTSFKQALYFKEIGFNIHDTMIWEKYTIPLTHKRYEQSFEYMFVFVKGKINTFNGIMTEYSDKTLKRLNSGIAFSYKHRNGNLDEKIVRSNKKEINKDGALRKNVWKINPDISIAKEDKYLLAHPARFPEKLAEDHILSWSNEGDIILDPFFGSGTTGKVAKKNNRSYIGFEISQEYCNIAEKRLE